MRPSSCPIGRLSTLFVLLIALASLALSGCGESREDRVYHVGILSGLDFIQDIGTQFEAEMAKLGYIEGQNIVYDFQKTNFEPEREKQILRGFVDEKVDLIFTFPTEVSMTAKATAKGSGVPVLFAFANIEDTGLVDSIREPGEGITGVRYPGPDLAIKRYEIMRRLAPAAKRIWIPYQRGYPIVPSQLEAIEPIAASQNVTLIEFPADDAAEIQAELDRRLSSGDIGFDAILFVAEPLTVTEDAYQVLTSFAEGHRIPIGGAFMPVDGPSAIFGVNAGLDDMASKAAILADKILKGMPAGSIPVVSGNQYFDISPSAAERIGIKVPEDLLAMADGVVR